MKRCSFLFFFLLALSATAQRTVVRQSVEDDGQALVVEFDYTQRGTLRQFRRTFDVQDRTRAEKQVLLQHLVDSLGLPPEAADVALLDEEVPSPTDPLATVAVPGAAVWTEPVPAREAHQPMPVLRSPCPANRNRNVRPTAAP